MAEFRQLHVRMWKDAWFITLEPQAKLLWIYLFSNAQASVSGIYELPISVIAFETGLEEDQVAKTLASFQEEGKILLDPVRHIVWIKKLRQYNETNSIKVKSRIWKDYEFLPECALKLAYAAYYGVPDLPILGLPRGWANELDNVEVQNIIKNHLLSQKGSFCEVCGQNGYVELHDSDPLRSGTPPKIADFVLLCMRCKKNDPPKKGRKYPISELEYPIPDSEIPYSQNNIEIEIEIEKEIEIEIEEYIVPKCSDCELSESEESGLCHFCIARRTYKRFFPDRRQPQARNGTLRTKFKTRFKDKEFQEKYPKALERAAQSTFIAQSSFFDFGWFLKNDDNWRKCLEGNYDNQNNHSDTHKAAERYIEEQKGHVKSDSFRM